MTRLYRAIIMLVGLPLIFTLSFYFIAKNVQPSELKMRSGSAGGTTYIEESKKYRITGEMTFFPGIIVMPEELGNDYSTDGYSHAIASLKHKYDSHSTISSLSGIKCDESIVDDNYVATVFFSLKLPSTAEYGMWFPGQFTGCNIYINGEPVFDAEELYSEAFPVTRYIELPFSEDGFYQIMIHVISPKNFNVELNDTILFGSASKIHSIYLHTYRTSLTIVCFIIFSIIYFIIQSIALKNDSVLNSFIIFLSATLLSVVVQDDFILFALIKGIPYQVGTLLKGLASPLFLVALVNLTAAMYTNYFPRKMGYIMVVLQIIPLANSLLFGMFKPLDNAANLVLIVPYALCMYVFALAYEKKAHYALFFGISILLIESGSVLNYATVDLPVPSRYTYLFGIIALTVVQIIILSEKYAHQESTEKELQKELASQLSAMQASENAFLNAQMKPHFLYNTLNTIADLCVTDPAKAKYLINTLSEYLKLILSLDNMDDTVPLRRELELVDAYTAIEKERFPSINFYKDYPIRMPAIMMPPITIQPLIENAIKHGVRKSDKPGVVTLKIVEQVDSVLFYVSDNGAGMTPDKIENLFLMPKENKSIGIYNIDKRLKNQYHWGLSVESTPGLGTCVSFKIPKY